MTARVAAEISVKGGAPWPAAEVASESAKVVERAARSGRCTGGSDLRFEKFARVG
jgi:hypothetical protein